ncbi:MAG TPA: DUF4331 domain-containing protein [Candidatus Methylomirabilis sp.]|nr:DUF4331 domain-containing protein [Candidatus Methylomirabilis sp.]
MRARVRPVLALLLSGLLIATGLGTVRAASHREAPLMALDPAADITDVYAFVSYDAANLARAADDRRVTFIMNVIPGQDPSDGPNYFNFDDEVAYRINIDNDRDGQAEDVVYEFRFKTQTRPVGGPQGLTAPLPYLGNPHIPVPGLQGITALDGPGSEGLTRRQVYTVTEIRGQQRTPLLSGRTLVAVPSNVGPATMPDYDGLAAQGIYSDDANGIRVFAGQRAETFYIDLGAVFDTLNLRRFPPLLTAGEDANDASNPFGVNRFSGFNISTIAIEVPIKRITRDGRAAGAANSLIGLYASTSRPKVKILPGLGDSPPQNLVVPFVQVSRMGNPLVNELIINTPFKDRWNATAPEAEAQFQGFYKDPVIATALFLVYNVPVVPIFGPAAPNRTDLMTILLKYAGQALQNGNCGTPCSELLRLDLSVPPTAPENQRRLGPVLTGGADPNGWPNGRRPNDDVTDIAIRVVGGTNYVNARAGDGVNYVAGAPGAGGPNVTANGIAKNFPFLPSPYDGRNRRHVDCGEPDANPCN